MIKSIPIPWTTVIAGSTTAAGFPATGWLPALQVQKLRVNFEMRGRSGNLQVTLGYQTANVENSPDEPIAVGSYQTTNDVFYGSSPTDISANTLGKQLIRFVWMVKLSADGSPGFARVGGSIDYTDS